MPLAPMLAWLTFGGICRKQARGIEPRRDRRAGGHRLQEITARQGHR